MLFGQCCIRERRLHKSLAIIERAVDAVGCDVVAEGAQLVGLSRRDPVVGIEHDHADAGAPMERGGDGCTRIARSRDQHGVRLIRCEQSCQAARQEAGAEVFEGGSRPPEQFQQARVFAQPCDRSINRQALSHDFAKVWRELVTGEERRHGVGGLLDQSVAPWPGLLGDGFRHVQATIGSLAFGNCG